MQFKADVPKKRQKSENDSGSEKGEDVDFDKSYSNNDDKVASGEEKLSKSDDSEIESNKNSSSDENNSNLSERAKALKDRD